MFAIENSRRIKNWLPGASLLLLSLTIPLAAQPLFKAGPSSPPTGAHPHSLAVGDFNGDGIADFATANTDSNNVTVFLGNGAGRFTAVKGSPFPVGAKPQSLAVGDLNGDGKLDLAIANAGSNSITVLLGDGAGGFTPSASSPIGVGSAPDSVAIGDINGDGKLDMAIANGGSDNVTVLLGDGAGRFTTAPGSPFGAGTNPQSVAMGDLNGDGHPDLAIANAGSNTVTVLRGNGAGGFTAATGSPFAVGTKPQSVAVGDFNGDGKLDLATANTGNQTVTVLLQNGTGGFTAAAGGPVAVEAGAQSVAVGDFNGDGKLDLATANAIDNSVTVLLGNDKGGFAPAAGSPFATGSLPACVAVGDFNGDGKPDLAAVLSDDTSVAILLNRRPQYYTAFHPPFHPLTIGGGFYGVNNPWFMTVGDFNKDGRPDLAVVFSASSNVAILLGNDTGGFTDAPGSPFAVGLAPYSVAVGDFNNDGALDLATANARDNTVTILLGNGTGKFTEAPGSPFAVGNYPESVAVGDFNGDGKLDLATADYRSDSLTVLLGDGKGGFAVAPGSPFPAGSAPNTVLTGDFNGDGKTDIAVAGYDFVVFLGNGMGGFADKKTVKLDRAISSALLGDFNGDGTPDVVTLDITSNEVNVLLGDGAGGFTKSPGSPAWVGGQSAAVGDFNGDGKLDLVIVSAQASSVAVLLGDGTGGLAYTRAARPMSPPFSQSRLATSTGTGSSIWPSREIKTSCGRC